MEQQVKTAQGARLVGLGRQPSNQRAQARGFSNICTYLFLTSACLWICVIGKKRVNAAGVRRFVELRFYLEKRLRINFNFASISS